MANVCVLLPVSAEGGVDSATADPALVKERSVALRRRVSSRPTLIDRPPSLGDRSSTAAHDFTIAAAAAHNAAAVLAVFALTYV